MQGLAAHGYEGWFVVEAEQDPKVSPPLEMARIGHKALTAAFARAGFAAIASVAMMPAATRAD